MPSDGEVSLALREFRGVNLTTDPAFVDPSSLQLCDNWVPDLTYLLTKRRGSAVYQSLIAVTGVDAIFRAYDQLGNRYLYAAVHTATVDQLQVSKNDGAFETFTAGGSFTSATKRYSFTILGNRVYVANDTDNIKVVDLGVDYKTATTLDALPVTSQTGINAASTAATATLPELGAGTYSYCWAVYNTSTKKFTSRGLAFDLTIGGGQYIAFTAPSTALGANEVYQLFVAPRGLPVEFGHNQTVSGLAASGTFALNSVSADGPPTPMFGNATLVRHGKFLAVHRGRIFIAGDGANPSRLYATGTIVPGLEQAIFDLGDFFPANANIPVALNDGDAITGIAEASLRETNLDPTAPFLIFKNSSTWALFGDILDDDSAQLVQISNRVGCIAHATIVNTPVGVIFCGHDSVYLIRGDSVQTIDIGQDIYTEIRNIPRNRREYACAMFHKGFYKLAYTPAGGGTNSKQLWLDLRRGMTDGPSWWGPHTMNAINSMTKAIRDTAEDDRGWAAFDAGNQVFLIDQPNSYQDNIQEVSSNPWNVAQWNVDTWNFVNTSPISSVLRTKAIDAGQPFQRKTFTRFRCIGRSNGTTAISIGTKLDFGREFAEPSLSFDGPTGAQWNQAAWNISEWGASFFEESLSLFGGADDRPRGLTADITLTHTAPLRVDLRDFELTYLPVDRKIGPSTVTQKY